MHPYFFERLARDRQLQLEREAELARLSSHFPRRRGRGYRLLDVLRRRSRRRLIVLPEPVPPADELAVLPERMSAVGAAAVVPGGTGDDRDALVR